MIELYDHGYWYDYGCRYWELPIFISMNHGVFQINRQAYDLHDTQRSCFHQPVLYKILIIIYGTIPDS